MTMISPQLIFLMLFLPCIALSSQNSAYPSSYGDDKDSCGSDLKPLRREVYGNGKIFDITHRISSETRSWDSDDGVGDEYLKLYISMKNGTDYNFSEIKLPVHSGTHVDAPGHVFENYYDAGFDIDSLDLEVLNGIKLTLTNTPIFVSLNLFKRIPTNYFICSVLVIVLMFVHVN